MFIIDRILYNYNVYIKNTLHITKETNFIGKNSIFVPEYYQLQHGTEMKMIL